jgi:hypothetical protein
METNQHIQNNNYIGAGSLSSLSCLFGRLPFSGTDLARRQQRHQQSNIKMTNNRRMHYAGHNEVLNNPVFRYNTIFARFMDIADKRDDDSLDGVAHKLQCTGMLEMMNSGWINSSTWKMGLIFLLFAMTTHFMNAWVQSLEEETKETTTDENELIRQRYEAKIREYGYVNQQSSFARE